MTWGRKTGGRQKGTRNRRTSVLAAQAETAVAVATGDAAAGEEPIDYMLKIMRHPSVEPARRDAMAKAAAPYRHPQLQAVAHKLVDDKGHPLAPVVNLTVSTPKLEDKTPKLTHDGAKKGDSVR